MNDVKVSINKSKSDDVGYRYKMRKILTSNPKEGITKFLNIGQVSDDIKRPKSLILKWIGLKKSANILDSDESIKTSLNDEEALQLLYEFNDEFVNCKTCGDAQLNPIVEKIKKDSILKFECVACGDYSIPSIENRYCEKITKDFINILNKNSEKYKIEIGIDDSNSKIGGKDFEDTIDDDDLDF